jgi:two-component system nitrate/nitrite response regulator NarL
MANNSNPGTIIKKNGKGYEAMILVASADAGLRQKWALGLQDGFAIHEVSERAGLECSMTNSKPAVLLLDANLPQLEGVENVSTIQDLSPSTKVIFLSTDHNENEAIRTLKARAKGYCNKDIELSLLRKAINVVQKGEIWVERKTISRLFTELTSLTESQQKDCSALSEVYLNYLTPREHQIALLIGEGACNREIASQLDISERTVKGHLTAIFQRLQIPNRLRLGLFVKGLNH